MSTKLQASPIFELHLPPHLGEYAQANFVKFTDCFGLKLKTYKMEFRTVFGFKMDHCDIRFVIRLEDCVAIKARDYLCFVHVYKHWQIGTDSVCGASRAPMSIRETMCRKKCRQH